jgi:putative NADH-flavin reductase
MAAAVPSGARKPTIAVLGASGGVGRRIVELALARGFDVAGQTRAAPKLADLAGRIRVHACDPRDAGELAGLLRGADAAIFALGIDTSAATTLFSDATRALIAAMQRAGVRRLVAITGIGAGETRGHGGWLYDRVIFPLFTRRRYADKDRQEALIAASGLDWIIVRPARFVEGKVLGPLEVHAEVTPATVLRRITRDEVAAFVLEQVASDRYLRQRPFIGHP